MAEPASELQNEIEKLERKHAENPEGRYFVPLANDYRKMGDLERAEELLREGIAKHPEYLSAHIVMGRCLADRGANLEAAEEFSYVLSMDPQNLIALRSLGELATADGNPSEAERWYRELLAVDPMNEDARRAIAALENAAAGGAAPPVPEGEGPWDSDAASTPAAEPEPEPASGPPVRSDAAEDPTRFGELVDFELDPRRAEHPDAAGGAAAAEAGGPATEGGLDDDDWALPGAAEPLDDVGSVDVVTETIAELYARQGLHDRAAEVYRELIRRRGGDAHLAERLAELERAGSEAGPEDAAAPAAEAPPEFESSDSFAASFAGGFESEASPSLPQGAGEDDAEGWEPAPTTKPVLDIEPDAFEETGAGTAEPALGEAEESREEPEFVPSLLELDDLAAEEPEGEPLPAGAPVTIGAYLASLAQWEPGRGSDTGAGMGEYVPGPAAAEGAEASEAVPALSEPDQAVPDAPPAAPTAEPESAGSADDALPWEVPAPDLPDAEPGQESVLRDDFNFGADEPQAALEPASPQTPAPEAAPAAPAPETAPEPAIELDDYFSKTEGTSTGSDAPAPADDEDDLESFQAWLRSLKR
jgi:tetratricopeptide (TPR) repeat protein